MKHHTKTQAKALTEMKSHGDAVTAAITKISDAVASVPGLVNPMTAAERRRVLKMHTGGERYVLQMADLAAADAGSKPSGVDPEKMKAQVNLDDHLAPLEAALKTALQRVQDARLLATGSAWHDALDVYALVQTQARRDPSKHQAIAGFEQLLASGPHAKAPPKAP